MDHIHMVMTMMIAYTVLSNKMSFYKCNIQNFVSKFDNSLCDQKNHYIELTLN